MKYIKQCSVCGYSSDKDNGFTCPVCGGTMIKTTKKNDNDNTDCNVKENCIQEHSHYDNIIDILFSEIKDEQQRDEIKQLLRDSSSQNKYNYNIDNTKKRSRNNILCFIIGLILGGIANIFALIMILILFLFIKSESKKLNLTNDTNDNRPTYLKYLTLGAVIGTIISFIVIINLVFKNINVHEISAVSVNLLRGVYL